MLPSLWVERLVHVAVPNEVRQPEQSGGSFRHTARCPKASPLGLESSKVGDETVACVSLEDERQLGGIASIKWKEAVAIKV